MKKTELPCSPWMYPMPVSIIGTVVNGKVNYNTIAYCGIISHRPPMVYVSMSKHHHSTIGIKTAGAFTLNLPRVELLRSVDYCGVVSGRNTDKSGIFAAFFGETGMPLIEECALNFDCRVEQILDFGANELTFIGRIVKLYADDEILTDGRPDIEKLRPLCLDNARNYYYGVGKYLAPAYAAGKGEAPEEFQREE